MYILFYNVKRLKKNENNTQWLFFTPSCEHSRWAICYTNGF